MNSKQIKLTHCRDNILAELREKHWKDGEGQSPIRRLMRGEFVMGDGHLISVLATLVAAELGIQDEWDRQGEY